MTAAFPFRTVGVLALCQALAMTCAALVITITALVGRELAPDRGLATLPLALQFLGLMAATTPASILMRRFGRGAGFSLGAVIGAAGGLLSMQAILLGDFWLYCAGAALMGAFLAHAMYYRFAAAEVVDAERRSRAISLVMAGGVLAAVAGPQLANLSQHLLPAAVFAGGYLVIAGLCAAQLVIVQFAALPPPQPRGAEPAPRRPLGVVLRTPTLMVAMFCGMVAYGAMNLVMSVTPPAMADCHIGFDSTAFVIQWHVLAMYAPSFFTGHLIHRFGVRPVVGAGATMMLGCVAIALTGVTVTQFALALVLLGCGWNFMFVGATTWVAQIQGAGEKAAVQALNEVLVFGTVAPTAVASGWIYDRLGWSAINLMIVLPLLVVLAALVLVRSRGAATMSREAAAE